MRRTQESPTGASASDKRLTENKAPGLPYTFWQNWVELMPVAWLALGVSLFVISPFVAVPAAILKLSSSAPTTLVGAHEKNARQRSSRRRTASRTRRRSETLRLID